MGAAEALQIPDQRQAAVAVARPSQLLFWSHLNQQGDGFPLIRKALEMPSPMDRVAELLEGLS